MKKDKNLAKEEIPEQNIPTPYEMTSNDISINDDKACDQNRIIMVKTKSAKEQVKRDSIPTVLINRTATYTKDFTEEESFEINDEMIESAPVQAFHPKDVFDSPVKHSDKIPEGSTTNNTDEKKNSDKNHMSNEDISMSLTINDREDKDSPLAKLLPPEPQKLHEYHEPNVSISLVDEEEKFEEKPEEKFEQNSIEESPRAIPKAQPQPYAIKIRQLNSESSGSASPMNRLNSSGNSTAKNSRIQDMSPLEKSQSSNTPYNYSPKLEDFQSTFDIEKEVEELKDKVIKNLPPKVPKKGGRDKRNRYKNFIPQSKDEIEKQEHGPDKLPEEDMFYKKRATKEYENEIEMQKVASIVGVEQTKRMCQPFVSKISKKFRSKSQERKKKKKRCKRPNKKRDRKNSVNITIQNAADGDIRRNRYKNKASNFDSIASYISDFNETDSVGSNNVSKEIEIKNDKEEDPVMTKVKSKFNTKIEPPKVDPNPQDSEDKISEGKNKMNFIDDIFNPIKILVVL